MKLTAIIKFTVLELLLTSSITEAFVFGALQNKWVKSPSLIADTEAQTGSLLDIKLDIGKDPHRPASMHHAKSRMAVVGLQVELVTDDANYKHPKLPGSDGPHPQLSSGPRTLNVNQEGFFVSMEGMKTVDLKNGCWELIWREGAPAGSLVCGFDLEEDAVRNDAVLPKGRIYLSFPVWTKEGLAEQQIEKYRIEDLASKYTEERKKKMEDFQTEPNIIKKALLYRDAAEAFEKYTLIDVKRARQIPSDNEVVPIKNGLLLTTKGLVWSKEGSFRHGHHDLLGAAMIDTKNMLKP